MKDKINWQVKDQVVRNQVYNKLNGEINDER